MFLSGYPGARWFPTMRHITCGRFISLPEFTELARDCALGVCRRTSERTLNSTSYRWLYLYSYAPVKPSHLVISAYSELAQWPGVVRYEHSKS